MSLRWAGKVRRQVLTMRMGMRGFTGLANALSKKVESRAAQVPCISFTTATAGFTRRFALRQQRKLA